jgi:hypothetical protein
MGSLWFLIETKFKHSQLIDSDQILLFPVSGHGEGAAIREDCGAQHGWAEEMTIDNRAEAW